MADNFPSDLTLDSQSDDHLSVNDEDDDDDENALVYAMRSNCCEQVSMLDDEPPTRVLSKQEVSDTDSLSHILDTYMNQSDPVSPPQWSMQDRWDAEPPLPSTTSEGLVGSSLGTGINCASSVTPVALANAPPNIPSPERHQPTVIILMHKDHGGNTRPKISLGSTITEDFKVAQQPLLVTDKGTQQPVVVTNIGSSQPVVVTNMASLQPVVVANLAPLQPVFSANNKSPLAADTSMDISQNVLTTDMGLSQNMVDADMGLSQNIDENDLGLSQNVIDTDIGLSESVVGPDLGLSQSIVDSDIDLPPPIVDADMSLSRPDVDANLGLPNIVDTGPLGTSGSLINTSICPQSVVDTNVVTSLPLVNSSLASTHPLINTGICVSQSLIATTIGLSQSLVDAKLCPQPVLATSISPSPSLVNPKVTSSQSVADTNMTSTQAFVSTSSSPAPALVESKAGKVQSFMDADGKSNQSLVNNQNLESMSETKNDYPKPVIEKKTGSMQSSKQGSSNHRVVAKVVPSQSLENVSTVPTKHPNESALPSPTEAVTKMDTPKQITIHKENKVKKKKKKKEVQSNKNHSEATNALFTCDKCDKEFSEKKKFMQHKLSHMTNKPFKCDQCPKRFYWESHLTAHTRTHKEDTTKFICDVCNHSFKSERNLLRHKLVHMASQDYKCEVCNLTFQRKCELNQHTLHIHSKGATADKSKNKTPMMLQPGPNLSEEQSRRMARQLAFRKKCMAIRQIVKQFSILNKLDGVSAMFAIRSGSRRTTIEIGGEGELFDRLQKAQPVLTADEVKEALHRSVRVPSQ